MGSLIARPGRLMLAWFGVLMLWSGASMALDAAQARPRARDLGVPFTGTPGAWNAITDVPGVEVGEVTLVSGSGKRERGRGRCAPV